MRYKRLSGEVLGRGERGFDWSFACSQVLHFGAYGVPGLAYRASK